VASTGIVANSIPIGVGIALADKTLRRRRVTCVFLGDAAVEEGVFHESANFAVLRKLPVLFICENNRYSVYTPLRERQPEGRRIWQWVRACGMRAGCGNGNDAWGAYVRIRRAVEFVRTGGGPVFLEFSTYRWREHCGPSCDDDLGYRPTREVSRWRARDPIGRLQRRLLRTGVLDAHGTAEMDAAVRAEVEAAFSFAENSPFPGADEAFALLFAE
jgi:pyruvate dehydrogenase E1 component alpha subunit